MRRGGQAGSESSAETIKVCVRVRPLHEDEPEGAVAVDKENSIIVAQTARQSRSFVFDSVFPEPTTQEEMFSEIALPVVQKVKMGYNGTIFAYGQSGTGKTYTMEGDSANPGINRRIFDYMHQIQKDHVEGTMSFSFSMCQLYCEQISDLLDPSRGRLDMGGTKEMGWFVRGLSEFRTNDSTKLEGWYNDGVKNRITAATGMNKCSSRSHCIAIIRLFIENNVTKKNSDPTFFLVDLAGSENASMADYHSKKEQRVGSAINKALLALGNVINSLVKKAAFIPFSDSKLTQLLSISLGGGAYTTLILNVSSNKDHLEQTVATLEFGKHAKAIKINAKVHETSMTKEVVALQAEIERMKQVNENLTKNIKEEAVDVVAKEVYEALQDQLHQVLDEKQALQDQNQQLADANHIIIGERDSSKYKLETKEQALNNANEEIRTLNDRINSLKDRVAVLESENAQLSESGSKKQRQLTEAEGLISQLREQNAAIDRRVSDLRLENDSLHQDNDNQQQQLWATTNTLNDLRERHNGVLVQHVEELAAIKAENEKALSNLSSAKAEIAAKAQELNRSASTITQLTIEKTNLATKISMMATEHCELEERHHKLNTQLKQLYRITKDTMTQSIRSSISISQTQTMTVDPCDAITMRLDSMKSDLDSQRRKVAELSASLEQKIYEVSALNSQINDNNSEFIEAKRLLTCQIEQLDADLSEQRFAQNRVQTELVGERDRHQKDVSAVEQKLADATRENRCLKATKDDLENTLKLVKSALEQMTVQKQTLVVEFDNEKNRLLAEQGNLKKESDDLRLVVSEKQQAINGQGLEIRNLQQSIDDGKKLQTQLEQKLATREKELAELDQKWRKLVNQFDALSNELESAREENQSIRTTNDESERTIQELKSRVAALENDLKQMVDKHTVEKFQMLAAVDSTSESSRELMNNLAEVKLELEDARANLEEAREQIGGVENKLQHFFSLDVSQTVIFTEDLIDRLINEAKDAKEQLQDLERLNDHVLDQTRSLEEQMAEMEELRQQLSQKDTTISELESANSDLLSAKENFMQRFEEADQIRSEYDETKNQEIRELNEMLASSDNRITELTGAKNQETQRADMLQQEFNQLSAAATEKDRKLGDQESQISQLTQEMKQTKKRLETESGQATKLKADLQAVTRERDVNVTMVLMLQSQKETLTKEVTVKSGEMANLQQELSLAKSYQSQFEKLSIEFQQSICDRESLVKENNDISENVRQLSNGLAAVEAELNDTILQKNEVDSDNLRLEARLNELSEENDSLKREISGHQNQVITELTQKNAQLQLQVEESKTGFVSIMNQLTIVSTEFQHVQMELQAANGLLSANEDQYRQVLSAKDLVILETERKCVEAKREQEAMKAKVDDLFAMGRTKRGLEITEGDSTIYSIRQTNCFSLSFRTPNVMVTEDRKTAFSSIPGRNCIFIDRVITNQDRFTISFSVHNQLSDLRSICFGGIHAPFNDLSTVSPQMYLFNAGQGLANHRPNDIRNQSMIRSTILVSKPYPQCSIHSPINWFPVECDFTYDDTITIFFEGRENAVRVFSDVSRDPLFEFTNCIFPMIPCIYTLECSFFAVDITNDLLISRRLMTCSSRSTK